LLTPPNRMEPWCHVHYWDRKQDIPWIVLQ